MATRYNPYALDPALSAGIGNLTKALIGSASDDAAIARGRASDALAGLRASQTRGQDAENEYLQNFNSNMAKFLSNPEAVKSAYDTIGLTPPVQNIPRAADIGFDSGAVDPGIARAMGIDTNQQKNIPYIETVGQEVPNDVMSGLVGAILKGGTPGNPQQTSNMGLNLQQMSRNALERNAILNSGQSLTGMARLLAGDTIGQYDEPGAAENLTRIKEESDQTQTVLKEEGKTTRKSMSLDNDINITKIEQRGLAERQQSQLLTDKFIANQELTHKTKIKKMELALKEEMEILKTETTAKTNRLIAEKKRESENANAEKKLALQKEIAELKEQNRVKIAKMTDSTKRWEFENRTLTATFDEVLIVSEEYAKSKQPPIPMQTEGRYKGMYIIDGGPDPSKMMVKLNANQTIYMKKELADDFNIPENERGQFKAEGMRTKTNSGLTDAKKFDTKYNADFQIAQEKERYKLPTNISINLRAMLQDSVNADVANGGEFTQVYNDTVIPYINGGNTQLNPPGVSGQNRKFVVPTFLLKTIRGEVAKARKPNSGVNLENFKKQYIEMLQNLGYSKIRANYIYDEASQ